MKAKLESSNLNFQKQKSIAVEIYQKFGGTIIINVEPNFDIHSTNNTELYIDSIQNLLVYNISIYNFINEKDNILTQFDLTKLEDSDKSRELIQKIKTVLIEKECKIL